MATDLSQESMKQFVADHFEEFVNRRNAAVIHRNMTPDFLDHDGPGGKPTDLTGDEKMMLGMYEAMPDLHVTVVEMLAEGDKVMCRNIWQWTDRTTGQPLTFQGFVLWRFQGRRIAERWATVSQPSPHPGWA
ncbi:ester cyclase [Nocardia sp. NPDC059240]|uniref:ester cyclase n=1 Tax=Nocardia sp. NPDC059240 TaxID=3346786 RepID=UPI0036B7AFE7